MMTTQYRIIVADVKLWNCNLYYSKLKGNIIIKIYKTLIHDFDVHMYTCL